MDYVFIFIMCILTIIFKSLGIILLIYVIYLVRAYYRANYGKTDIKSVITNVKEDFGFTKTNKEEKGDN